VFIKKEKQKQEKPLIISYTKIVIFRITKLQKYG